MPSLGHIHIINHPNNIFFFYCRYGSITLAYWTRSSYKDWRASSQPTHVVNMRLAGRNGVDMDKPGRSSAEEAEGIEIAVAMVEEVVTEVNENEKEKERPSEW
jgi:hypothetical protein